MLAEIQKRPEYGKWRTNMGTRPEQESQGKPSYMQMLGVSDEILATSCEITNSEKT